MSSSCICNCCQGLNCIATLAGSINVNSPAMCLSTACTQFYPVSCAKNLTLHGKIEAIYSGSNQKPPSSNTIPTWVYLIAILGVISVLGSIVFCVMKRKKDNPVPYQPPMQPAYQQQPVYINPQPVYAPQQQIYAQQQPYAAYPPQPQYGAPPAYNQSMYSKPPGSGMNPVMAGAGGFAAGVVGGVLLDQALHNSHHHNHYGHHDSNHHGYEKHDNQIQTQEIHNVFESVNPNGGTEVQTFNYSSDNNGNVNQSSTDQW
ncbi:hypothetical protein BC833DRAFT_579502 [Globomyces pollinis-pini]|nr:hypothetical protein BC833DRAFT_579502 [Globomyces pollinis-pini]